MGEDGGSNMSRDLNYETRHESDLRTCSTTSKCMCAHTCSVPLPPDHAPPLPDTRTHHMQVHCTHTARLHLAGRGQMPMKYQQLSKFFRAN